MPPLNHILDAHRQNQFGRCYASSSRSVLCSVVPHLAQMQRASRSLEWRAGYRSGIVTCRSALHVLHKKDGPRTTFLATAIDERFQGWKASLSESPFHLLDDERNMLLKEGRPGFPVESRESYSGEPQLLCGSRFMTGSEVVRFFMGWVLQEVTAIEDAAFWSWRNAREIARTSR